jgi:hypothetical protein
MSRTAIRFAKSAACVGAGNNQETSFAESCCTTGAGCGCGCGLDLQAQALTLQTITAPINPNLENRNPDLPEVCMGISSDCALILRSRAGSNVMNSQGLEIFD